MTAYLSGGQKLMMEKIEKQDSSINEINGRLVEQNQELKAQKDITFFFTIIVAATLMATLVGLAGLYISAIKDRESSLKEGLAKNQIYDLIREIDQLRLEIAVLKAKNPYLK